MKILNFDFLMKILFCIIFQDIFRVLLCFFNLEVYFKKFSYFSVKGELVIYYFNYSVWFIKEIWYIFFKVVERVNRFILGFYFVVIFQVILVNFVKI